MAELLAPAGNIEALNAAINEGADAVYLGVKSFNARMRSSNFSWSQFEASVETLHKLNKKIYVTVNTVVTDYEMEQMYSLLKYLNSVGPDALIVQDLGVVRMIHECFPKLNIHASTQMNIASASGANAMSRFGVSRVVLARELSMPEIKEIKQNTSSELEMFVHGALCISESGLCMFSSFLGGKSANRGMCTQACRRMYNVDEGGKKKSGFYFSPYDLQLINYLPELVQAGVDSFKIEGRMKSAEYVGTVVSAYRYVLDNWEKNPKEAVETGKRILANDFAREKTSFMLVTKKLDHVLNPKQAAGTGLYLGKIDETEKLDITEVKAKGDSDEMRAVQYVTLTGGSDFSPVVGDSVRLHSKNDVKRESWKIQDVRHIDDRTLIQLPADFSVGDNVYLLQTKSMSKRYPSILPKSLAKYRKRPMNDLLPKLHLELETKLETKEPRRGKKNSIAFGNVDIFPDGYYVQVSSLSDLHAILIDKPTRVIINLNEETEGGLLTKGTALPFSKKEIFISLDPFMPQENEADLQLKLDILVSNGFKQFVLNNPAHITMLRNKDLNLIAGPYLYSFNQWAVSWLKDNGLNKIISPIENSQENLELTYEPANRSQVLLSVFAYPALFRIRNQLPKEYDFLYFSDKMEEQFRAFSTPSAAFVLPEKPFAITEKIKGLEKKGFHKYLIDFSHTSIERQNYKIIMTACRQSLPLPDTSKFNWKEGFYDPERVENLRRSAKHQEEIKSNDAKTKNTKSAKKYTNGKASNYKKNYKGEKSKNYKPATKNKSKSGNRNKNSQNRKSPRQGR